MSADYLTKDHGKYSSGLRLAKEVNIVFRNRRSLYRQLMSLGYQWNCYSKAWEFDVEYCCLSSPKVKARKDY